ncbi:MAG: hypothetical protein IJV40_15865 [Oscillospiraceae bacterium]|nr:hypothetical protein [Oscillospiraceae bacterium]
MEYDEELGALIGSIDFPCCKARALIYEGTKARFSVQCPICGKFTLFDTGQMSAATIKPLKGATRRKLKIGSSPS